MAMQEFETKTPGSEPARIAILGFLSGHAKPMDYAYLLEGLKREYERTEVTDAMEQLMRSGEIRQSVDAENGRLLVSLAAPPAVFD